MEVSTEKFKSIKNKDINLNVYCEGNGPLVIMAHGWPESWYSWRHQIKFLAANGYSVAVPDMRGYGNSSKPSNINDYDIKNLTSDIISIADHLRSETFYLIGHDWGAPVVWNTCLDYKSRVKKACGMSVPHTVSQNPPIETMKFLFKGIFFYMLYFQEEGVVEKELEADMRRSLLSIYGSLKSDGESTQTFEPKPYSDDIGFLDTIGTFNNIPDWMNKEDFEYYLGQFEQNGMRSPINWYRNIDRNWAITKETHDHKIDVPTCFIVGEDDPVSNWAPINESHYSQLISTHKIKGAGHWVQQEKPDAVNKLLLEFFNS